MATTIAHLGQNFETGGKLFRLLGEDGLQDEVTHVLINDPTARAQAVQFLNLLANSSSAAPSYQRARDILGDDFISPQEVADARDIEYTEACLAHLQETLPEKEVLQWARDNGYLLVAGPPSEMNLLDIRDLNPQLFYSKSGGWFSERSEKFARKDKVGTAWLVLRKAPVLSSTSKTWSEQLELLKDNESVPNVAEATWGFTTYAEVRGTRLVPSIYVRTSSVDSNGYRVFVGHFDVIGLYVLYWWDDDRLGSFGVSSVRKF